MEQEKEPILEFFKKVDIFSDLDERALRELSNLFSEEKYKEGEIIFAEESIGNSMMIIHSGEVRVSQTPNPDTEEALIVLKKGDFFWGDGRSRRFTQVCHHNSTYRCDNTGNK